ncbi:MAG: FAD-dependent oxidoreductase, partial [Candidatus Subteraquimicrobiales bacterium]|nr:FAD-dependent oxidoreductase [Candidatus Subteraquimicrobiales bacterium]
MQGLGFTRSITGAALIVGGGIAGIQTALDLAESGIKVYLVESSPAIGGKMAQLDKTFPTNDCAICILSPKLVECGRHPNIDVITNAEIRKVDGEVGNFTVIVDAHPRYVNPAKCTGCGNCAKVCPVSIPDEFNEGLSERKAIYMRYPQAIPMAFGVDIEHCRKCKACMKKCEAGAINLNDKGWREKLNVGAIVLAPGYEVYDARLAEEFGFGRYPNVVTSLQFERILSASGPYEGHIKRPPYGREPQRIAFLQCVGSRDRDHDYCSSFCCMYATKEAMLAREHLPQTSCHNFMMDMRSFGKGFERYYERARTEYGIDYVRCRVSSLKEIPSSRNLILRYEAETGEIKDEEFDLVVLSVGAEISAEAKKLAKILGINLNEYGFCWTDEVAPLDTSREGIYVCGPFSEPKDISDSVAQASGSAARALSVLSRAKGSLVKEKKYPKEKEVEGKEPRVGIFVCHCGSNIAGVVDVKAVVDFAWTLNGVVHAENLLYA